MLYFNVIDHFAKCFVRICDDFFIQLNWVAGFRNFFSEIFSAVSLSLCHTQTHTYRNSTINIYLADQVLLFAADVQLDVWRSGGEVRAWYNHAPCSMFVL